MVKKAFQDSNLIEIKGNATASVATISELKEVFGGGETGDVTVSVENITDVTPIGKNLLLAETQTLARAAIGAGTSNLDIGTSSTQAAAGNHTHSAGQISKTPIGEGDETGNMQEALAFLMSKISTLEGRVTQLENPTP